MTLTHWMIWCAAFAFFAIVECLTTQLIAIWFALGCVGGGIAAYVTHGENLLLEAGVFLIVTTVALIATRPLVRKLMHKTYVPTNTDALIGKIGKVTEAIDNSAEQGTVFIEGKEWSARTAPDTDTVIPKDSKVEILRIEGVKLIVKSV